MRIHSAASADGHQAGDVPTEVNISQALGAIKLLMDQRHRAHPALALVEQHLSALIGERVGLQPQQTADDLQIILDTMVNFFEQRFFLAQRGRHPGLGLLAGA
jgi:hypothetical protein